jgi:NitT/TauT family transport system ATP-binding protein
MIRLERLSVVYEDTGTRAVHDLSLEIEPGERVVLLGPSGCGKTTVLKALLGLLPPEARVSGRVDKGGARVSAVFQRPALFPWLTVRQNVAFPLRAAGRAAEDRGGAVTTPLLRMSGLAEWADRLPHQLSAGMRQRASFLRALVAAPDLVVMDEPFSSLDPAARTQLAAEFVEALSRRSVTALFVTHDIREALAVGDRLLVLTPSPGREKARYPLKGRSAEEKEALLLELAAHYES